MCLLLHFAFSLCVFTYAYPVSFLSKCHAKNRKEVLAVRTSYRSSCTFNTQPQRSSCGFQDSSSSDPQSAARRTSCGRKKKFLRVHYFWAVLYLDFNAGFALVVKTLPDGTFSSILVNREGIHTLSRLTNTLVQFCDEHASSVLCRLCVLDTGVALV